MRAFQESFLKILLFALVGIAACAKNDDAFFYRTSTEPIGTSIRINTGAIDELNCEPGWPTSPPDLVAAMAGCSGAPNGSCSWLEAFAAAQANRPVDSCPAGVADAVGADAIYVDVPTVNLGRQFNLSSSVSVLGDLNAPPRVDLGGRARALLISSSALPLTVELSGLAFAGGCVHGGNCLGDLPADVASGGIAYWLTRGTFNVHDVTIRNSSARTGGALAVCTTNPTNVILDNIVVEDSIAAAGGGGGFEAHGPNEITISDSAFRRNRVRGSQDAVGGNIRIEGGHALITNTFLEDGVAEFGRGGNLALAGSGSASPNQNPVVVDMVGGHIYGGLANWDGGSVFVQAGAGGQRVTNANYCPTGGCLLTLTDVDVRGGTADSPASFPVDGNGGALAANTTGPTPGRIELRGTTVVSGGADLSPAPRYAPDCSGTIDVYDSASVVNPVGCTIVQHGPPAPVCGNGSVESMEQCDDGNLASNDGCSSACISEVCVEQCVETTLVCT